MEEVTIGPDEAALSVERSLQEFERLFRGADAGTLERPNAVGEWSLRDLLTHVIAWHEECLWAVRSTAEGTYERRDYSDVDGWNAEAVSRYAGLPAGEVIDRLGSSGRAIAAELRKIDHELWTAKARLERWVAASTVGHYLEHQEDVRRAISGEAP